MTGAFFMPERPVNPTPAQCRLLPARTPAATARSTQATKPAPVRAQGTLGEVATGRKWQAKKIPLSAGKYRQRGKLSTPGLSMLKI